MEFLNKLILGTAQFGLDYGINNNRGRLSDDEAFGILSKAKEEGILYVDTAAAYGDAEEKIGSFISAYKNPPFKVITKINSNSNILSSIQNSLRNLKIDRIDTLLFHSFSHYSSNINNLDKLNAFVNDGIINRIGVSVYTNDEIEGILKDPMIDVVQVPFNLLDNENQRGAILKRLKSVGKTVHIRSVFLQGLFYRKATELPDSFDPIKKMLKKITDISVENKISLNALALQYALSKSYIDAVLFGVDTLDHFTNNLEAINEKIPESTFNLIDEIIVEETDLLNPSLWNIQR